MVTIALRRPARTWWPALLVAALVALAGGVVVADAPSAGAAQTPASCANSIGLVNGGFEEPTVPVNDFRFLAQSAVPGWSTTASDGVIEIWHNNFSGVSAAVGAQFAELNANLPSALYQDLPTIPGTVMRWSLAHRGRIGTDTMAVSIGPAGGALVEQARMSDGTSAWGRYSGFYTVPDGQTSTRFSFGAISTQGNNLSIGNFLDDISFGTNACVVGNQTLTSPTGEPYAQVGDLITVTVKANSGGGSPAMGTTVTSSIPPGTSFVPGSIRLNNGVGTTAPTDGSGDDVGEYDPSTRQVVVRAGNGATSTAGGNLANEEVGTVTYQVRVDSLSAPRTSTSESTVRFTDPLTNTVKTSTTNTANIVLSPIADLAVTLARTGGDAVVAGLTVTYTATLTNKGGPSTVAGEDYAYGTKLTSQLPAALTNVSGTTSDGTACTVTAGVLTCAVGTLARNASRTVTLTATVASDTPPGAGALVLTVTGSTGSRDLDQGNNTASVTSNVTASADVVVSLTAAPSPAVAGTDTTYTAVLTNRGPSMARDLELNDPMPAGTSAPRASVPGGTCSVPTGSTGSVRCSLPTLAAGASTPVTLVFRSDPSRTEALVNKLTVSATTPDPDRSNNTASLTTPVTSLADVRTVLSLPTGNIPLGSSFPFTVRISNGGPSTAVNIQLSLRDGLPNGVAPTSLPAGCTLSGCTIASLAPGGYVDLKGTAAVAKTTEPGRKNVTVTATADTQDPDYTNNTGRAVLIVGAPALQVTVLGAMTDTRRTRGVDVGDKVVWTYVIANAGDVDVTNPTVVLPGTTTAVGTTCSPGTLPKGRTAACRVVVPQTVTAADVSALAVTTTVQVTAGWVGGTEVRSPSATGSLATVLPAFGGPSAALQGAYLSATTGVALQEAATLTDAAPGSPAQSAVAIAVLIAAVAGTALALRPRHRRD
ncbi:conserved exported protein of unknown function [Modestobacter italicus]|uniref:DUF11 domain-containing protein n=1 Tax=Modestobacter italicus (strain DSM 44449 / CECT 9708 / BC 501) TaxID=2732864 RepID=I4ETR1_MODI5|nr:DUF11 domain-containing protein [Modestobacter marinus]CCH86774.1 conserved exported protein of unknown function [Modestobacter marinus]